jgi:hypothetical protein
MNTMLANDCQALLFIYINNILVGGTPLFYSWKYGWIRNAYIFSFYVMVETWFSTVHLLHIVV